MVFIMVVPEKVVDEFVTKFRHDFPRGKFERFGQCNSMGERCVRIIVPDRSKGRLLKVFTKCCRKANLVYRICEYQTGERELSTDAIS